MNRLFKKVEMKKTKNEEVQKFLNEIMITDAEKSVAHIKMRQFIFDFFQKLMKDPNSHLICKGKYRRHLKILTTEDASRKQVGFYVRQAI